MQATLAGIQTLRRTALTMDNFTISDTSGNTNIGGTLDVAGNTELSGNVVIGGNISSTSNRNISIFSEVTDKIITFGGGANTILKSSGKLDITGISTLSGDVIIGNGYSGSGTTVENSS